MRTFFKRSLTVKTASIATILLCITLLSIGIGLNSFRQYQSAIDSITSHELQVLVIATKLSQQSDAVISSSSTLLLAKDQAERRRALFEISERGEWMDKLIRQLQNSSSTPDSYIEVAQTKDRLMKNLSTLDRLIQRKIALQQGPRPSSRDPHKTETEIAQLNADLDDVIQKNKLYSTELSISVGYHLVKTKEAILDSASSLKSLTHDRRYLLLGAAFAACASVILLSVYIHIFIVRRIVRLQHAVRDNRPLPESISDVGNDEISKLSATIKRYIQKISENEEHILSINKELETLATYDSLTKLYNRNHFDKIIIEMNASTDTHFCVSIVDIDHFKSVNDTFGHRTGDLALAHIAATIKSGLRASDIVARYGGEEFVILMHKTDRDVAHCVLERIRQTIEATPLLCDQGAIHMTASFGFFYRTEAQQTLDECLRRADSALYMAKNSGRNVVIAYSSERFLSKED